MQGPVRGGSPTASARAACAAWPGGGQAGRHPAAPANERVERAHWRRCDAIERGLHRRARRSGVGGPIVVRLRCALLMSAVALMHRA
jgi:hypothetical protein